ncbi:MAG: 50S ribosomal protein L6 [Ruminococcaceae bacterium]|nr:50S ribosomal protein L6 [Oscillospiraceae bacterium]
MSRIGKMPIDIPAGVDVTIDGSTVTVKGPKGELTRTVHKNITVEKDGAVITVTRPNDENLNKSLHGLTRTLIANMVEGVSKGYTKELEVNGVGYRAAKNGNELVLTVGYSHPVTFKESDDIKIEVPGPNKIIISGSDKQKVGQFAAEVREVRPPEPYKGKGIKYVDEYIRRKEGKAAKGGK